MNKDRWERIKRLFARVRHVPTSRRTDLLARECGDDRSLLFQVQRLLEREAKAGRFLEPPAEIDIAHSRKLATDDLQGTRLGDFELTKEIGRGAMGVVYLARQLSLGRKAAVKVLASHLCLSLERQERFRREAKAASRLRHPNVVSIIAFGEQDGLSYMAMEYVAGQSLREVIGDVRQARQQGAELPPGNRDVTSATHAARIILGVTRALEHCHGLGIIHRDVKPHNILLDHQGEPRLVDFGLAKDVDLDSLSAAGSLTGTPHYMSPEQAQALGNEIDHRTDIYSVGAVLYELLTLERPFEGPNSPAVLYCVTHEKPRAIAELNPRVPPALAAICAKAMSKRQDERYQAAADLALDLERFLHGERVRAPRPSLVRRGYEYVFHRQPWIAASAAVVGFALVVLLSPRQETAIAAAPMQANSAGIEQEEAIDASLSPEEFDAMHRRKAREVVLRYLESKLPQDPIYHEK